MSLETQRQLEIIYELQRHGWKRDQAGQMTGNPFEWRDPRNANVLHDMFGALRIVRDREREKGSEAK